MMQSSDSGERSGPEPIASEKVAHERKVFFLDLKENQRGRFLKITEDVGGRRDTIMLPAPAFRVLRQAGVRFPGFSICHLRRLRGIFFGDLAGLQSRGSVGLCLQPWTRRRLG
jgi:hypothetical protein